MEKDKVAIFESKEMGLRIGYPAVRISRLSNRLVGWRRWTGSNDRTVDEDLLCFTPEAADVESPSTMLNLMIQNGDGHFNLETYTSLSFFQLEQMLPGVQIQQPIAELTLSGLPGKRLRYLVQPRPGYTETPHFTQCWTVAHGHAFVLTLLTPNAEDHSRLSPIFESCVAKFLLLPNCAQALAARAAAAAESGRRTSSGNGPSRDIVGMYCMPHVDPLNRFMLHYPSGWKLATDVAAVGGGRVFHAKYQGPLSALPDEAEVLISVDVSLEPTRAPDNATLDEARAMFDSIMESELAKIAGRQWRETVMVRGRARLGDLPVTHARLGPLSGLDTGARNGNERVFVDVYWGVAPHNHTRGYVVTFTSTVPADDRRERPLFARILASFTFIDPKYRPKYLTRRYENLEDGVKIDYPVDLVVQEGYMGATVSFLHTKESGFGSHVSFACSPLAEMSHTENLDEFSVMVRKQLQTFIQDCNILEEGVTTLGGVSARKLLYSGRVQDFSVTFLQVYTIRNKNAVILSFASEQADFEKEIPRILATCFDSFEFTDPHAELA